MDTYTVDIASRTSSLLSAKDNTPDALAAAAAAVVAVVAVVVAVAAAVAVAVAVVAEQPGQQRRRRIVSRVPVYPILNAVLVAE